MWDRASVLAGAGLGSAICALLSSWICDARAQSSSWDLPEFKEAAAAADRWDCKTAWEIIWPLAKEGNAEARLFLAVSLLFKTDPPGVSSWSSPPAVRDRHMLTVYAYGALGRTQPGRGDPDHKWMRRDIPIYLKKLALGAKGDQVAQCYQSGGAFRDCLDLAVSLGVVQRFEDYAQEVERAERETGRSASCRDPHGFVRP